MLFRSANSAIQAWNLELTLPKLIVDSAALLSQINAHGMMQIQISDFNIFDPATDTATLENANLAFNVLTNIDQQRAQQWLLSLNTLDLSGEVNALAPIDFNVQQTLTEPLIMSCSVDVANLSTQGFDACTWQGTLHQLVRAEDIEHTSKLSLDGTYQQSNSQQSSSHQASINSRQILTLNTQQHNPLWPKANNQTQGEIIVHAQHVDNRWHWQLNLPFGLQIGRAHV